MEELENKRNVDGTTRFRITSVITTDLESISSFLPRAIPYMNFLLGGISRYCFVFDYYQNTKPVIQLNSIHFHSFYEPCCFGSFFQIRIVFQMKIHGIPIPTCYRLNWLVLNYYFKLQIMIWEIFFKKTVSELGKIDFFYSDWDTEAECKICRYGLGKLSSWWWKRLTT